MNYAENNEIIRKHLHDNEENLCIAVLSIIPLRKTFLTKIILIQGALKNIQGLLWKFEDFSWVFHNFSIFKDFSGPGRSMIFRTSIFEGF